MPEHWQLGCSNAARWVNCPGSKYAVDDSEAGFKAELGTLGHKVCEYMLNLWFNTGWNGMLNVNEILDEGDREILAQLEVDQLDWFKRAIRTCVDAVKTLADGADEIRLEHKTPSVDVPDHGGTCDVIIWFAKLKLLIVVDFKFGSVAVDCLDNEQVMSYLNLARQDFPKATKYQGVIVQPANNGVDACKFTTRQLNAFKRKMILAADPSNMQLNGDPYWCEYCPLLATCDAAAKMTVSAVEEFGSVPTVLNDIDGKPSPAQVERLERIVLMHKLAKTAYDKASAIVKAWASEYDLDLHYHRVTSSNYRGWKPSALEQLEQLYGSDAFKKTPISPPELQQLLGMKKKEFDKAFAHMIELTSRPTLKAGVKPSAGELAADLPIYNEGKEV